MHLEHPLLRPGTIEDRPYQGDLARRLTQAPHLLVLPTGLGKTVVALRAILHYLLYDPPRKVLLLAPTKPLCDQHGRFLKEVLKDVPVNVFTGDASPSDRDARWSESRIVVATPQVIQNDLVRGARDLSDVSFLIYDEAHRATGQYPYAFIARRYRAAGGRWAAGLTASPGNHPNAVQGILHALNLERVEVRTERDPDVAPFVHQVETEWLRVPPSVTGIRLVKLLTRMYARCVLGLRRLGYLPDSTGLPGRKDLLGIGQRLRNETAMRNGGRAVYEALTLQTRALKLQHALELAETQGSALVRAFLERVEEEAASSAGSKAARDLVHEPEFHEALRLAREDPNPSPKQTRVVQLVQAGLEIGQRRILVFANYRETADALVQGLAAVPTARVSRFVGHGKAGGEPGLTRRAQEAIVERFRTGDLNVLVATAVGEEGLDLPETDAVILHEPVPSAIRLVQRRGRTGRRGAGRMIVLLTEGTRDVAYQWSAMRRERAMYENLRALRAAPALPAPAPGPAPAPSPPGPEITMDNREAGSPLARELVERAVQLRTTVLSVGDYAVGERTLVERKSASDFVASIRDGRLFRQLPDLARAGTGVLLVEGDPYAAAGGMTPAAISGALAAAASDHRVSVLVVPGPSAAADVLVSLARRESRPTGAKAARLERTPRSPGAQQRFVLEGVPSVGPVHAHALLSRFGTLEAVAQATVDELQQVDGIGPETARALHELFHRHYLSAGGDASREATLQGGDAPARAEGVHLPTGGRQILLEEASRLDLVASPAAKHAMAPVEAREPQPL